MFGHTHKSRSKTRGKPSGQRRLETRDEKTEAYGIIKKALGNCSFTWENVNTGKEAFTKTAGRLTRGPHKVMIKEGDHVLIEVIDINVNKDMYMIKHVYKPEEVRKLTMMGELTRENPSDDIHQSIVFESDVVAASAADSQSNDINIDDI
jgi:initiation factor 1A